MNDFRVFDALRRDQKLNEIGRILNTHRGDQNRAASYSQNDAAIILGLYYRKELADLLNDPELIRGCVRNHDNPSEIDPEIVEYKNNLLQERSLIIRNLKVQFWEINQELRSTLAPHLDQEEGYVENSRAAMWSAFWRSSYRVATNTPQKKLVFGAGVTTATLSVASLITSAVLNFTSVSGLTLGKIAADLGMTTGVGVLSAISVPLALVLAGIVLAAATAILAAVLYSMSNKAGFLQEHPFVPLNN